MSGFNIKNKTEPKSQNNVKTEIALVGLEVSAGWRMLAQSPTFILNRYLKKEQERNHISSFR